MNTFYKIFIIALFSAPSLTVAQSFDFATGKNNQAIEITADNGIEWQRDNQIMIATGNARAVRGAGNIEADVLQAYYEENKNGGSGLVRLDGIGRLKISSATQSITGETGVYDLKNAIIIVTGKKVTLISDKDKITSTKQMEYYEKKEMAIARGNAVANHEGNILRANTLVVFFLKDKNGKVKISRVQAFENVRIVTKTESIWANKGIYDVMSGIVTLNNNVRIKRDGNELNGENAIINLNTGVSKLLTSSSANSHYNMNGKKQVTKKRVRGFLVPKRK